MKAILLRLAGVDCDASARVVSSARIISPNTKIGFDTFIGHQVLIAGSSDAKISIGHFVDIAPRVVIISGTHLLDMNGDRAAGKGIGKSVNIGDGTWIGANSTILPGVSIGSKAVIGAGSVVVNDIPPLCVAVGNPCRPIKFWSASKEIFEEIETP